MKTRFFRILGIAIVMVAFSASTFGQNTATAAASARIITPISITKTVDLHFGTIIAGVGTVTVTPAGGRSTTGPVLSALAPAHTAASFTVSGESGLTYSISLSAGPVLISDGTNTMSVNTFVTNPTPTGTLTGGTETLTLGATLTVTGGATQPSGTYTNLNAVTVTVNYN